MDPDRRQMRQLKRAIKRAGSKSSRQRLRRNLVENPSEADEAGVEYGRNASAGLNDLDRDATRRRADAAE
jgi:hypothetical protein